MYLRGCTWGQSSLSCPPARLPQAAVVPKGTAQGSSVQVHSFYLGPSCISVALHEATQPGALSVVLGVFSPGPQYAFES